MILLSNEVPVDFVLSGINPQSPKNDLNLPEITFNDTSVTLP